MTSANGNDSHPLAEIPEAVPGFSRAATAPPLEESFSPQAYSAQVAHATNLVRFILERLDAEIAKTRRTLEELEGHRNRLLLQLREIVEEHASL
jgi:hypothetical protein